MSVLGTCTLKNPAKCIWRWEPDRRFNLNFFFSLASVPSHIWLKYRCMWRKTPINSNQNPNVTSISVRRLKVNEDIFGYIGSEMNFHSIRYLWNELCVFISPSLWRGDIKHTTSFINTVWNEKSFHILFITCWTRKNARKTQFYRVLLPILLRKTRQRRGVTYDVID